VNLIKLLKQNQADIVLALSVVMISIIAFNIGKISLNHEQRAQIKILSPDEVAQQNKTSGSGEVTATKPPLESEVVASKNSTLYHFPWCSGAARISEKNKIIFPNESAAISAGYTLAGNCNQ